MIFPPTLTTTRDGFASIEIGWSGPGIFTGLSIMTCLRVGVSRSPNVCSWRLFFGQEQRDVLDEPIGILILRPVGGVRIEDQLCIREMPLQN